MTDMNPAMDVTFLTDEQYFGDARLELIKRYGTKTGMSDLAVLLGGLIGRSAKTSDNQFSGYVWSASSDGGGDVRNVRFGGDRNFCSPYLRLLGARPALPSSVASAIGLSEAKPSKKISGVDVVEFGEYPQSIASPDDAAALNALSAEALEKAKTSKTYIFDAEKSDAYDKPFTHDPHPEYELNGKRYIRVKARLSDDNSIFSDGSKPKAGESYWVEVQPIEWLREPEKRWNGEPNPNAGMLVARQALFAGVQFDDKSGYDGNFVKTSMKRYLQNHFNKESGLYELLGKGAGGAEVNYTTPATELFTGGPTQTITGGGTTQKIGAATTATEVSGGAPAELGLPTQPWTDSVSLKPVDRGYVHARK